MHGRDHRHPDAVEDRVEQARRREIADVIREPDELAVGVLEALRQQRPERQRDRQHQPRRPAATMPARITQASRETFCAIAGERSGTVVTLTAQLLANTRSDSGGSAMVSFWPFGDAQIAHQVGREIGEDRHAGRRLRLEPRAAERAEEIEQRDLRGELVRRRAVDVAHAHFLGAQPDAHRRRRA